MKYEVGYKIRNPLSGDESVFAGYLDGEETWCDVGIDEMTNELRLCPVEIKTFNGFNGEWTQWSADLEFPETKNYH
jgi:hypothetical protein